MLDSAPANVAAAPVHFSVNGRPLPTSENTAFPWRANKDTQYIILASGLPFYVKRVERSDIDTLNCENDLKYLAMYAATIRAHCQNVHAERAIDFILMGAMLRLTRLHRRARTVAKAA